MATNTMVSIITPMFNSENYIGEAIQSVQRQTYSNWEMIIVDDASSDRSVDIALEISRNDPRIKLHALSGNYGAGVARNKAISISKGRYIAFLDSDDLWVELKLERQINYMREKGIAFCHSWYQSIDICGNPVGEPISAPGRMSYREMLKSNRVGCLTAIYDRELVGLNYMPIIRKRQDYALWLEILKKTDFVYCVPEILARYRIVPGSISSNKLEMMKYHFILYRRIEQLNFFQTLYYLFWNVVRRIRK